MVNAIVKEKFAVYDKDLPTERRVRMHYYWCPGCDALHGISINPDKNSVGAGWTFTGTLEKPTYSPSQLSSWEGTINGKPTKRCCHTFIREGMIQFLNDCTHGMAGQTVPLPPLPEWVKF